MSGIAILRRMKFFDGLIKGLLNPDPHLSPSKGQILVMIALIAFVVIVLTH
ncbi:MAG TPA: hypothetical protein VFI94_05770 [Pseudolabrys sp.]|jgi:hypothetical protein|nr:hypothetical protein [Pseudolabrys sp.]